MIKTTIMIAKKNNSHGGTVVSTLRVLPNFILTVTLQNWYY